MAPRLIPQLNNKDTKTQRLETKECIAFDQSCQTSPDTRTQPSLKLAIARLLLRAFVPLLFTFYCGI
jgi:hypothetical protein